MDVVNLTQGHEVDMVRNKIDDPWLYHFPILIIDSPCQPQHAKKQKIHV